MTQVDSKGRVPHRLVHCCYNSDDADAVLTFIRDGLGLPVAIKGGVSTFAVGEAGSVRAHLSLIFDQRGPRVGTGIELQSCIEPPAHGTPYASVRNPGIQALGLAVADLDAALEQAFHYGAHKVADIGDADLDRILGTSGAVSIRDARGVTFDLVASEGHGGTARMRHIRITCRNVEASSRWYRVFGAIDVATEHGVAPPASAADQREPTSHRMRFSSGDCELILCQWPGADVGESYSGPTHRGLYRIALAVDDMSAAVHQINGAGVPLRTRPALLKLEGTKVPPMLAAFYQDPDGVPVEVIERDRSAFQ